MRRVNLIRHTRGKRQRGLHCGRLLKERRRPWVGICRVKIDEVICVGDAVQMADDALCPLVGRRTVHRGDDMVIAAHAPVVQPHTEPHQLRRCIAVVPCTLRERCDARGELHGDLVVEHLAVVWIEPGLDGRQRRIGVLGDRELLIEDQPARKKACRLRHHLCEAAADDLPGERIDEDIQYQTAASRMMSDLGRGADEKCVIGGEVGRFMKPIKIGRGNVQPAGRVDRCRVHVDLLWLAHADSGEHSADDGEDDLLSGSKLDMRCTGGTLCAHQIKDKVACGEVTDALCITDVLQLPCLIALLSLLRVDTDIVGTVVAFGCGEKLAGKEPVRRGDARLWIIGCACGERHERRMRQDDGQAVKCLLRDRFMRIVIHRDWRIGEPVGVALHE